MNSNSGNYTPNQLHGPSTVSNEHQYYQIVMMSIAKSVLANVMISSASVAAPIVASRFIQADHRHPGHISFTDGRFLKWQIAPHALRT
jgi:hypothetical protein